MFRVHLKIDEKITLTCGKDGGLQNLEVHGILLLKVASEDDGKIKVQIVNTDTRNLQLQVIKEYFLHCKLFLIR